MLMICGFGRIDPLGFDGGPLELHRHGRIPEALLVLEPSENAARL